LFSEGSLAGRKAKLKLAPILQQNQQTVSHTTAVLMATSHLRLTMQVTLVLLASLEEQP
jgi:hypothetical protein